MDEHRRQQRARTFDEIAKLYDHARPYYREELFDDLFRLLEQQKREWFFSEMRRLISARPGGRITNASVDDPACSAQKRMTAGLSVSPARDPSAWSNRF